MALADPSALRVLDTASIIQLAENVRRDISKPGVERWRQEAVAANRLQRVVRGLYLNRLITPRAQLCEAAVWLRPGAVISLQTVLGDSGEWNNFTRWATAVVPLSSRVHDAILGTSRNSHRHFCISRCPGASPRGRSRTRSPSRWTRLSARDAGGVIAALAMSLGFTTKSDVRPTPGSLILKRWT
jgi:hypothetical protein